MQADNTLRLEPDNPIQRLHDHQLQCSRGEHSRAARAHQFSQSTRHPKSPSKWRNNYPDCRRHSLNPLMSSERAGEPIATRPFIGVLLHHKRLSLNTPNVGEEQRGLPGETVDKELHAKE